MAKTYWPSNLPPDLQARIKEIQRNEYMPYVEEFRSKSVLCRILMDDTVHNQADKGTE